MLAPGALASGERPLPLTAHHYPGRLITLCGVDGSGKTSTSEAIRRHLAERVARTFVTRTPTTSTRQHAFFRALVDTDADGARPPVDLLAVCLVLLGDLRQHLTEVIEPRLRDGYVVICDRYFYTHLAEMLARAAHPTDAEAVFPLAPYFIRPDVAIFMDVGADVAAERVRARGDVNDRPAHRALAEAQVRAYRAVAAHNGLLRISSEQPLETSLATARLAIDRCLASRRQGAPESRP